MVPAPLLVTPTEEELRKPWPDVPKRQLLVPKQVFRAFYEASREDVENNVETLGVLCGVWSDQVQALVITHILIPDQVKSQFSCDQVGETSLLNYQRANDLQTLGWFVFVC